MESLYILIPVAVVFSVLAVGIFYWSVKSGQFDDLNTEGKRILFDDVARKPAADNKTAAKTENDQLSGKG